MMLDYNSYTLILGVRIAAPIDCAQGFYSLGRNESCIRCPAGQKCPNTDGTSIEDCPPGQYSVAGSYMQNSLVISRYLGPFLARCADTTHGINSNDFTQYTSNARNVLSKI